MFPRFSLSFSLSSDSVLENGVDDDADDANDPLRTESEGVLDAVTGLEAALLLFTSGTDAGADADAVSVDVNGPSTTASAFADTSLLSMLAEVDTK